MLVHIDMYSILFEYPTPNAAPHPLSPRAGRGGRGGQVGYLGYWEGGVLEEHSVDMYTYAHMLVSGLRQEKL